ncbi:hypothetical protein AB0L06_01435 [Spirillospora sp. NPDC052269]
MGLHEVDVVARQHHEVGRPPLELFGRVQQGGAPLRGDRLGGRGGYDGGSGMGEFLGLLSCVFLDLFGLGELLLRAGVGPVGGLAAALGAEFLRAAVAAVRE